MVRVKVKDLKSYWGKAPLRIRPVTHVGTEPILLSSDGFIIDGHKRVVNALTNGVERIDAFKLNITFLESEPLRLLNHNIKKEKNWELLKLYRKAFALLGRI